jgi:hypothetical protein
VERPFAFIVQLGRDAGGELVWVFVVRSVYERAHLQLDGGFPTA